MASRDNPLAYGTGYTDPTNPLTQGSPTWADAYSYNAPLVRDYLTAQGQRLSDPQTYVNALADWAQTMLMSTSAPGIRAFHGSPYSFERFDTSKIGTGEGAQAYGHGLYFAGNENVAQGYRDRLANQTAPSLNAADYGLPQATVDKIVAANMRQVANMGGDREFIKTSLAQLKGNAPETRLARDIYTNLLNQKSGSMYEVNIGANPEHFLDWDKPLSEQSDAVKSLIPQAPDGVARMENGRWMTTLNGQPIGTSNGWPDLSTAQYVAKVMRDELGDTSKWTGADLHSYLSKRNPGRPAAPAEQIQAAGIPGIRYLDAGSRGQGQGTSNYVVFDANTIDILRKYGIAGLIAGGGAAGAAGTEQPQQ